MNGWTRLIDTAEVPAGEGRRVRLEGIEPISVYHVEGEFFVVQDTCSHASASLVKGWIEGFEICCPVHDGRFDMRTGAALCFPATDPIRTFPTEVRDDGVWADLSHARARTRPPLRSQS